MISYRTSKLAGNYAFILPALFLFLVFSVYPLFQVFYLSVFQYDGISPAKTFVGWNNFRDLFLHNPEFWQSMKNAGLIAALSLTAQNLLALLLALACDREIRFGTVYRVIFYIPPVLSGIVVGLIWQWIYDGNFGLLNQFLETLNLGHLQRAWLSESDTALLSVAVIHMWRGFGWGFIILLAGLQSIPRELYEAAKVDGASSWHVFRHITVPLMVPVFILVAILTILGTMQIFDTIVSTTGGGPGYLTEVPMTRMIKHMITSSEYGYACAMGLVFGIMLLIASMIQIHVSKRLRRV